MIVLETNLYSNPATFTPASVIEEARYILNDIGAVELLRQQDDELTNYVNSCLQEMVLLAPMVFSTIGDFACGAGVVEQSLTYDKAVRLLDVIRIKGGSALTPFDRRTLDRFDPSWMIAQQGAARQWSPKEGDPLAFFLDRPAPGGQTLEIQYTRNPRGYSFQAVIVDVPVSMKTAMAWYVVSKAEAKDDENVIGQRSAMAYDRFRALLGTPNAAV